MPDYVVKVGRASGLKCKRCWIICKCVGSHPCWEELCLRCASVVCIQVQEGKWLPKEVRNA